MAIEFNCPYCTAVIRVSDDVAGKVGRCPKCETRLRVPQPAAPADPAPSAAPTADVAVNDQAGSPSKPPPPGDDFEAVDLQDLPGEAPESGSIIESDPDAVVIPDIPEPQANSFEPLVDTTNTAEPVYQRVSRSGQRNWTAILAPLVCGGILVIAGFAYWWMHRETMTGQLSGDRLTEGTTASAVIQRFVPDVSTEIWQAAVTGLREDPVSVQSELMLIEIRSSRRGIEVSVSAGAETDLVRVDVRRNNSLLNEWYIDNQQELDDARTTELKAATTRFLQDWNNASSSGMLLGNGQEYRDSVGLNALTNGLGYHSVALVGNTLYPCVYADAEGLYFVVPRGTVEFVITEREIPDQDSVFPGDYEFTVNVVTEPPLPEAEETDPPVDDAEEPAAEDPDTDMSLDPTMSEEAMEDDPESTSDQR